MLVPIMPCVQIIDRFHKYFKSLKSDLISYIDCSCDRRIIP